MHKKWIVPAVFPLAALLAGCHPDPITDTRRHAVPLTGPEPKAPKANPGPVKLGMTETELRRLPNLTVTPLTAKMEGVTSPALKVTQYGLPIALAELEGGKVTRLRYYAANYTTPEGARVGMRAQELGKLFGVGRLDRISNGVCVRFDRAPAERFCFTVRNGGNIGTWDQLLAQNPRVQVVILSELEPPKPMPPRMGLPPAAR